jgi:sec-independent protein translocase protein TatA
MANLAAREHAMTDVSTVLAFMDLGPTEMLVILVVALLIWGKRLPEVARNMGKSVSEFKKGIREAEQTGSEISREIDKAGNEATQELRKATDEAAQEIPRLDEEPPATQAQPDNKTQA